MRENSMGPIELMSLLGQVSRYLTSVGTNQSLDFSKPLELIGQAMRLHTCVLYKIANVVDDYLILEVEKVYDPNASREDLALGSKITLSLQTPPDIFHNEIFAFRNKEISRINIPGVGCDLVGYVYLPENFGYGYLLGGDYVGGEADVQGFEISVFEVVCNLLSAIMLKAQFEEMAVYDGLTGLYNSRAIREGLEKTLTRHSRGKVENTTVAIADVDHFKKVNDNFGHIQGDAVLAELGKIIKDQMRQDVDLAGRYGGEEFLLVLESTHLEDAHKVIERLRIKVENHPFPAVDEKGKVMEGKYHSVTVSFGMTDLRSEDTLKSLISRADKALYQSKKAGRNRVSKA